MLMSYFLLIASGMVWMICAIGQQLQPASILTRPSFNLVGQAAQLIFLVLLFIKLAHHLGIEWLLLILTVVTGISWFGHLFTKYVLKTEYTATGAKAIEHIRSFFPILLIVFVLRSFVVEPYRIPSSSLYPSLKIGDFILVNKYAYGLRWPILHTPISNKETHTPQVGDIMVFIWPVDPSMYFVKRVVGVPGDRIKYVNKVLYRNGVPVQQRDYHEEAYGNENGERIKVIRKTELLNGKAHDIYLQPNIASRDMDEVTVPPKHYFVMGDNRDGSFDSRGWGFVPDHNIVGRAARVIVSWDSRQPWGLDKIRWSRSGLKI